MKILLLLNRDLASSLALNYLLPTLARHEVRIGLSERVGAAASGSTESRQRRELRAAEQTLPNDVIFPLIERTSLPDADARFLTFGEVCRYRNIPVDSLADPNTPEAVGAIAAYAPDLILTVRYGKILKSPVIAIPPLGVLNLHSGALPAYRGVLASFRALVAGDANLTCTLHFITDGSIDTGEVVATASLPVQQDRSLLWHVLSLYRPGVELIVLALNRLASGTPLSRTAQPRDGGSYYSYPSDEDWAQFSRQGWVAAGISDLTETLRRYGLDWPGGDAGALLSMP